MVSIDRYQYPSYNRHRCGSSTTVLAQGLGKASFSVWSTTLWRRFETSAAVAVAHVDLSQMLRRADDQIRNCAAGAIRSFQGVAFRAGETPRSARALFRSSVQFFLDQVWPQERSLATREVRRELSGVPAVAGAAFADAVDAFPRRRR